MEHKNNEEDDAAVVADVQNSVLLNAVPQYNYVRRRKCNENVPICETKKKRESFRRVSVVAIQFQFPKQFMPFRCEGSVFIPIYTIVHQFTIAYDTNCVRWHFINT